MTFTIAYRKDAKGRHDTAIAYASQGGKLLPSAQKLDRACGGLISHVLKNQKAFSGKRGQVIVLTAPKDSGYLRIVLLGLGDKEGMNASALEIAGGKLMTALKAAGAEQAILMANDSPPSSLSAAEAAAHIALGMRLKNYEFTKYKAAPPEKPARLVKFDIVLKDHAKAAKLSDKLQAAAEGILFARDLVNEPPNELYPESFARRLQSELRPLGVEVDVMDEQKMRKLGFHAHLAVGLGSARPPRVVVMRWSKGRKSDTPIALVGKGVTFDTGGISIKPAASMDEMKMDMGGAAAVAGVMRTLALRGAKVNAVGIVGLAENMPSDRAYRPGDIIQSFAGKTIEILNTDAEGRLILCDALAYIQKTYNPSLVIDLATLTGAIMVALGYEYAGTFANKDAVWAQLEAASKATGEKLWRMPLDEAYKKEMESPVADLRNLGNLGRYGGACSAAGFLEHFIDKNRAWVHIDIAGTAWVNSERPLGPKYATGFGVRVLDRLIADHYENRP